jgi:ATP-dependent DNA ligase
LKKRRTPKTHVFKIDESRSRAPEALNESSPPRAVKPQLCGLVDEPPQGPEWLHEIKYDGYRMHARLDHGKAQLLTRTGLYWTHNYPPIAAALSVLPLQQAYFDGKLAAFARMGRPHSA